MSSLPQAQHASAAAPLRTCAGDGRRSLSPAASTSKRLKRAPRAEDDGFALNDEAFLLVLASSLDTADLVRCAATCRRWRRLVTRDADFIHRLNPPPPPSGRRLVRALAVGFFHRRHDDDNSGAPPRFLPLPSFSSSQGAASLDAVLDDDMFKSSRLMASRRGRLVLELRRRRASRGAALRLAVCNPVAGEVCVLPALSGKDRPGHYACALLTADDEDLHTAAADQSQRRRRGPAAVFHVVLVYKRRHLTVCRTYSSDTNAWGEEGKVTGAKISGRRLGEMDGDAGGVAVGGAVFWLSGDVVFGLRVDTLEATAESFSRKWNSEQCRCHGRTEQNRRLAVAPDGRLCAVQVGRRGMDDNFVINIFYRDGERTWYKWVWNRAQDVSLEPLQPPPSAGSGSGAAVARVCLRAACEDSGLVFFATGADLYAQQPDLALYALDLETKTVQLVPAPPGRCSSVRRSSWSFHGYEMDRVAYLTSLGERDELM